MNNNRGMLEYQLERNEAHLRSLRSYIKELTDRTAEHGTDRAQFEEDLHEAEHNVEYYESETERIKQELGESAKSRRASSATDTVLPSTVKQGIGSLILSSISFAAGTLLGSRMKTRHAGKDKAGGK